MSGRPTKYKEEYCEMLENHMKSGLSFESFGGVIGVCEDTLFEWKKQHQEFSDSYKKGRTASMLHWEEMGHDMVLAGQGNATTWIFNMKNRFGWKDKSESDINIKSLKGLIDVKEDNKPLEMADNS